MRTTKYLIVGGGLTADAASTGIREVDPDGHITVVSAEAHPPYARPPLSKALWTGKEESTIWRATEERGAVLRLGRRIVALDPDARRASDDRGETYSY
jgi:NADPH-dependent 2,4-dienoyl-CoA reductase/sulfur reductase-like enzyme